MKILQLYVFDSKDEESSVYQHERNENRDTQNNPNKLSISEENLLSDFQGD